MANDTHMPSLLIAVPLEVRWRDLDAFNHVNNATYLTYLEQARLVWLKTLPPGWFDESTMPVLASSQINYRRPITWPANLSIELSCSRVGKSSMTIEHNIRDANNADCLYSDGHVVMVWVNPASGQSVSLPQVIRNAVKD